MNENTSIPPHIIFAELLRPIMDEGMSRATRRVCARILCVVIQFSANSTRSQGERDIYGRLFGMTMNLDQLEFYGPETLGAIHREIQTNGHTAHFLTFLEYVAGVIESGLGDYNFYTCLLRR